MNYVPNFVLLSFVPLSEQQKEVALREMRECLVVSRPGMPVKPVAGQKG
jgi:hypothetical protein